MAVFPTLPTDNLYKFLALFGLVLVIFAFYFPDEKFARAIAQARDADKSQKLAKIRIDRKKAESQNAMNRINATMEKLKESEKLLRDSEAALKAKRQSNALESEIQAVREQVQLHNEKINKFWEEIGVGQARIAEFTDEISTATVNAEANSDAVREAKWEADLWSNVSLVCEVIGGMMITGGFYAWYTKVQKHQDTILRKQAGEIKEQADTRHEVVRAEKMNE
jgi:hypothetical protein